MEMCAEYTSICGEKIFAHKNKHVRASLKKVIALKVRRLAVNAVVQSGSRAVISTLLGAGVLG